MKQSTKTQRQAEFRIIIIMIITCRWKFHCLNTPGVAANQTGSNCDSQTSLSLCEPHTHTHTHCQSRCSLKGQVSFTLWPLVSSEIIFNVFREHSYSFCFFLRLFSVYIVYPRYYWWRCVEAVIKHTRQWCEHKAVRRSLETSRHPSHRSLLFLWNWRINGFERQKKRYTGSDIKP